MGPRSTSAATQRIKKLYFVAVRLVKQKTRKLNHRKIQDFVRLDLSVNLSCSQKSLDFSNRLELDSHNLWLIKQGDVKELKVTQRCIFITIFGLDSGTSVHGFVHFPWLTIQTCKLHSGNFAWTLMTTNPSDYSVTPLNGPPLNADTPILRTISFVPTKSSHLRLWNVY